MGKGAACGLERIARLAGDVEESLDAFVIGVSSS
jgi:hypothetical protein